MANILVSYTLRDVRGSKKSFPVYGQFNAATATLADLLTWADDMALDLDAITGAQVISESLTIYQTLPGGLKGAPVAGSDVEQTGLFTFPLTNLPSKVFTYDVPGLSDALAVSDSIDLADGDVIAFTGLIGNAVGATIVPTNDIWSTYLDEVIKGKVSFRKHP